jgi:hypothetical protein
MSKLKWWQKGIALSLLWIGLVFGVMWLHTGAKSDQIDELYGTVGGMVLGFGWVVAAVYHLAFWRQRVLTAQKPLSWKMVLLCFLTAAVVIGFLAYRDFAQ